MSYTPGLLQQAAPPGQPIFRVDYFHDRTEEMERMYTWAHKLIVAAGMALAAGPSWGEDVVWFVVAENPNFPVSRGDSYLLPLSDPTTIAAARALLAAGSTGIVLTGIEAGGDGFNRDVRAVGAPAAWSWHVPREQGHTVELVDIAIELCDGWPTFIEQDPQAFIANTGGAICFWTYTVVEELDSPPDFAINEGLSGGWFNPATPGQGLFVDVIAQRDVIFLGWFNYGADGPTGRPEDEHAWITAEGNLEPGAGTATLDALLTTGGRFDDPTPTTTRRIGQVDVTFSDCDHGSLRYAFDDGRSGEFPLQRIASRPGCVTRVGDGVARKRLENGLPPIPPIVN